MSSFYFGEISKPQHEDELPSSFEREFMTLKRRPDMDELMYIRTVIEQKMGAVPYRIYSESDFDYMYENVPNHIRGLKRGWVIRVDYYKPRLVRKDFVVRILDSPLYEIEMQREYDEFIRRKEEKMRVEELNSVNERKMPDESSKKKDITDDDFIKKFNRAKAEAEQNAEIPPTENGEAMPPIIGLSDSDQTLDNLAEKTKRDSVKKENEVKAINSYLRNLKKLKPESGNA